jgi:hypothetical protein
MLLLSRMRECYAAAHKYLCETIQVDRIVVVVPIVHQLQIRYETAVGIYAGTGVSATAAYSMHGTVSRAIILLQRAGLSGRVLGAVALDLKVQYE